MGRGGMDGGGGEGGVGYTFLIIDFFSRPSQLRNDTGRTGGCAKLFRPLPLMLSLLLTSENN